MRAATQTQINEIIALMQNVITTHTANMQKHANIALYATQVAEHTTQIACMQQILDNFIVHKEAILLQRALLKDDTDIQYYCVYVLQYLEHKNLVYDYISLLLLQYMHR